MWALLTAASTIATIFRITPGAEALVVLSNRALFAAISSSVVLPDVRAGQEHVMRHKLKCLTPAIAGVEFRHAFGDFSGLFTQVFLVDNAVFADDERHNSRISVV